MKGLKGAAYKKARKALEPYRQRDIKSVKQYKKLAKRFKSKKANYYKARKYCNRKKSAVVKRRGSSGSWSWRTRTTWINKNKKALGCWKVAAAKWNFLRLKDQYNNQSSYLKKVSKQVKSGWAKLKGMKSNTKEYKAARKQIEPLR
jgi:hypothetical protein